MNSYQGDGRANEQLNLIAMHTIWMREHNRIAKALENLNPGWDDEKLFQESRRILIAEYQHIIYNEWLPLILGKSVMMLSGMMPIQSGYSDNSAFYSENFDPRVTNEFATAAFRFGHSLIPSKFMAVTHPKDRKGGQEKPLNEIFFKPEVFQNDDNKGKNIVLLI